MVHFNFWILEILRFGSGFGLHLSEVPALNSGLLNFSGFGALGESLVAMVYQVEKFEADVLVIGGPVVRFELSVSCNKRLFRPV